jgi:hypothetical protein
MYGFKLKMHYQVYIKSIKLRLRLCITYNIIVTFVPNLLFILISNYNYIVHKQY